MEDLEGLQTPDDEAVTSLIRTRDSVARAETGAACGQGTQPAHNNKLPNSVDQPQALLECFRLDLVVMTRGPEGARLLSPTETIDQPGIPTRVRDTVGAGDALTASLITGLLRGESLETIGRDACERAAAVCAQPGAVPELPAISETTRD